MKKNIQFFALTLALLMSLCLLVACVVPEKPPVGNDDELPEWVDYVAQLTLDESSSTAKTIALGIENYVDGDTTHFRVSKDVIPNGVLKARYAAVNTPESTGKIEEYGKAASNFTHNTLAKATSILLESPTSEWQADSTGSRYMCWVWYKTSNDGPWRNLNLEILQNGLALASGTSTSLYGEICVNALNQAKDYKLHCYSGKPDPDMYYGDALQVSLRELRTNINYYNGKKVSFTGVTVIQNSNGVYVESLDEESGYVFGMYVYYGFTTNATLLTNLIPGNLVRIVGTVSEFNGTYQVSGLDFILRDPQNLNNTILIESGHSAIYTEIDGNTFGTKVTLKVNNWDAKPNEDGEIDEDEAIIDKQFTLGEIMVGSSVSLKNFTVTSIYTTNNGGDNDGAMTLTGTCNGKTMTVRTVVLFDSNKNMITEDYFSGKTIDVKGVIDYYDGSYQVKLINLSDAVIH